MWFQTFGWQCMSFRRVCKLLVCAIVIYECNYGAPRYIINAKLMDKRENEIITEPNETRARVRSFVRREC